MVDHRFFKHRGESIALGALAKYLGSEIVVQGHDGPIFDPDIKLNDVAPLQTATKNDITFFNHKRYIDYLQKTKAGVCIIGPKDVAHAPKNLCLLVCNHPSLAYSKKASWFYPEPAIQAEINPTASIHATAVVPASCRIDHGAIIGAGVRLGERCHVGAYAVLSDNVELGDDCIIGVHASLSHCLVGNRVVIYSGARVGKTGFGFVPTSDKPVKIPQLGRVVIGNDVEIGANTTVDRGSGPDTVIGAGTMIDNLVQIGHNVQIGRGCIVVAQSGISGSTKLEDYVVLAAQSGLAGHLVIGEGAQIGAKSGLMRDVEPKRSIMGAPGMDAKQFFRQVTVLKRLTEKQWVQKKE